MKNCNMELNNISPKKHWFALHVFRNKVPDVEYRLRQASVECYAPWRVDEEPQPKRELLVSSLLFFRATKKFVVELRKQLGDIGYVYTDPACDDKRPAVIPDSEMQMFILVTSKGMAGLKYFEYDKRTFAKGQHVRVIDGPFKGLEGYVRRVKHERRLFVCVRGVCAVALAYIPQCFLEKI